MQDFERAVTADPLLNNAEAEWFRDRFEELARRHGFPAHKQESREAAFIAAPCPSPCRIHGIE